MSPLTEQDVMRLCGLHSWEEQQRRVLAKRKEVEKVDPNIWNPHFASRQMGKTTKACVDAIVELSNGKSVVFVSSSQGHLNLIRTRLESMLIPCGMDRDVMRSCSFVESKPRSLRDTVVGTGHSMEVLIGDL